jgi:hypothetical protein
MNEDGMWSESGTFGRERMLMENEKGMRETGKCIGERKIKLNDS